MYVPAHFALDDDAVTALLDAPGAADLVTCGPDGPEATMLPFVHDRERGALLGHFARNNDHWTRVDGRTGLVIVRGPDSYVSPSWYASKAEHGRVVPTWNYVTAHVHGTVTVHDDVDWVDDVVRRLTALHERHRPAPWHVGDAPERFVSGQLRAIVGVEVRVERVEAKAKLSQNRPAADVDGVVAGLRSVGDDAGADAVAAHAAPTGAEHLAPSVDLVHVGSRTYDFEVQQRPEGAAVNGTGRGPVARVVVGVDGSPGSQQAVRWAAREAVRRAAPLALVNATSITSLYSSASAAPLFDDAAETISQESTRLLRAAADEARSAGATDVHARTDENAPALALRDASRSARLLVLGAAGRGRVGTALGSVTLTVASHAESPVVVVRGAEESDAGPVVVGVDGGPLSATALAHAFDEASVRGVGLTAVHVWSDSDVGRAHLAQYFELQPWADTRDAEERVLAERLAGFAQRYPDVPVQRRVEQDDPARSLVEASAAAGLVVVATRGRGGFSGLLLGSTGLTLIQDAACPVLLVGPESAPLP